MKEYIEKRALSLAQYILKEGATVRETAKNFGISKSTVHKDVTERLFEINPVLAKEVKCVLDKNKSERHIRGGMATKLKYISKSQKDAG
ncbi:putative DeoR family transcriptional regulator, stage III sporulation protein D [Alkalithermobacter thermoalcaliphilus JW-YL-7 = DSM 7308]|uniref:DeoR family transcriptional regulator, stage III sporulation protein D n=1 Tax=Alkalithermobacter thermoalcaliphilus JW-YL-7 = DSM 7308 TaxID=1121328 RepID=A0A150FN23_CLOPD|nr:sporulation transcriptional regulator SpoIIID [[Clostridium] paradoxum JW-YL-7 = DSM 7308]SHL05086.1 putative DeoR family transcriptional regulator, stage III sporulation protein D [[Clostridium] paradoxum JW-YL-7 = DSM 7308]